MRSELLVKKLEQARGYIEDPDNWGKGFYSSKGSYCAVGAVKRSTGSVKYQAEMNLALFHAVREVRGSSRYDTPYRPSDTVISFNDAKNTAHEDVIEIFDIAINNAKQQGSLQSPTS